MKVRIKVTAEDIAGGVPGSYFECPVAIAARRHIQGVVRVRSHPAIINADNGLVFCSWRLPEYVEARISRYDALHDMTPFAFDLEVDESWVQPTS